MIRSTALLTVLLAFAIFAIPTSAAPPNPYALPVLVVNQASDPVKVRDVSADECKREMFFNRIKVPMLAGANYFEILNDLRCNDHTLVIETISVKACCLAADRIVQCSVGTKPLGNDYKMAIAIPVVAMNRAPTPEAEMVWMDTTVINVVWPFTDEHDVTVLEVVFEPDASFNHSTAHVECTVFGYLVDSACPTPRY